MLIFVLNIQIEFIHFLENFDLIDLRFLSIMLRYHLLKVLKRQRIRNVKLQEKRFVPISH